MIEIILHEKSSAEISEIVKDLKGQGLKTGVDFDFEYHPGTYDWATVAHTPKWTKFTFYNEKYGTFFALRWSQ